MSSNSILLVNPSFDPATASRCDLLIKIGFDSFSYAIIDAEQQLVLAVFDEQECTDVIEKFSQKLQSDVYLTRPYRKVKFTAYTPNVVHVPAELYEENQVAVHTQYFTDVAYQNVYVQPQEKFNTVFSLSSHIDQLLDTNFENVKRYETNSILASTAGENISQLLLDFSVGAVAFISLADGLPTYQNTFEIETVEEFNYYLLLVVSQLKIIVKNTGVKLSGIIHEGDERYNCINQYFDHIQFNTIPNGLNQEVTDDMPSHYYTNLLALHQCE